MSTGDYLLGLVLFAAAAVPAGALAWRVVRLRLGHLDRLEGALATGMLGVSALIAIHLVPLTLGVLSRATVLVTAALVAAAAVAVRPAPRTADAVPRPRPGSADRITWILGGGTAVVAAVAFVAYLREWLSRDIVGVDTLTFHLPNAARWMESGSLWQIDQFIPLQAQGYYPNHGDVLLLAGMLPWDNDFFVRIPYTALLVGFAIAVAAAAREIGGSPPVAAAVAAMMCTLPIVAVSAVPRAMPDVLLLFALACAGLFLLRHARTGRRSDLLLGALGLGLALGTKWYGLPTAVATSAAVAVGAFVARRGARAAIGDGVLTGTVALAVGGIWLVRNLVEISNPLFSLKVAPLGVTIFDAPRDVVSEQVGFSISDYFGDPGVLFGDIARELEQGLGYAPVVLVAALVAGAVLAWRARSGRVLVLAGLAVVLAALYTITPNSALGFKGDPREANFNTRYVLPALLCMGWVAAWLACRDRRAAWLVCAGCLVAVLTAIGDAFAPLSARGLAISAVLCLVTAGGIALVRRVELARPVVAAGALVLLLGAVAYGARVEDRVNSSRFGDDPVLAGVSRASEDRDLDIAIAGDWNAQGISPVWPSFGPRIDNHVAVIGHFVDGFLTNFDDRSEFVAALRAEHPDVLIVGNGLVPRPGRATREQRWAQASGFRVIARSDRLTVMTAAG